MRVFAALREVVGKDELELDLPDGATVESLWKQMVADDERLAPYAASLQFAVNHDFVPLETELNPDDEVAFLPPVSGG